MSIGIRVGIQRRCEWLKCSSTYATRRAQVADPCIRLNEEITAFYQYMSPTTIEYEVRLFTIELIVRTVKSLWPDATVTPFGSWQTQLYLPTG